MNSSFMASTAPLTTEESNPKRKPPTAPATARPMTLRETPEGLSVLEMDMVLPREDCVGMRCGRRRRRIRRRAPVHTRYTVWHVTRVNFHSGKHHDMHSHC